MEIQRKFYKNKNKYFKVHALRYKITKVISMCSFQFSALETNLAGINYLKGENLVQINKIFYICTLSCQQKMICNLLISKLSKKITNMKGNLGNLEKS